MGSAPWLSSSLTNAALPLFAANNNAVDPFYKTRSTQISWKKMRTPSLLEQKIYIIAIINSRMIIFEVSTKSHKILLYDEVGKRTVTEWHHGLWWSSGLQKGILYQQKATKLIMKGDKLPNEVRTVATGKLIMCVYVACKWLEYHASQEISKKVTRHDPCAH